MRLVTSASRPAMTLIELMVVIAILVTLVAGVLPLISPNNDARKIADAARSLQTYFMQAQAEAQRLGRPVGVGFRESAPGSGVALEVFQLAVPKPFAGPTIDSRAIIKYPDGQYGDESLPELKNASQAQGGTQFIDLYAGRDVYLISFVKTPLNANKNDYNRDTIPRGMLKIGDVANLAGNQFLIVDTRDNVNNLNNELGFSSFHGIWLNDNGQALPTVPAFGSSNPGTPKTYAVHRQPTTDKFGVSSESPYQLPTGVAIDLQASGVEGLGPPETFAEVWEGQNPPNPPYQKQIGIMFSPQGGIDGVWVNDQAINLGSTARSGNKLTSVARVFLMLGRVENQNPSSDLYDFDLRGGSISDDELRTIRTKVNWLNPDSRWLMINAQNGRLEVAQSAMFDPRNTSFLNEFKTDVQNLSAQVTASMASGELQLHGGATGVEAEARKTLLIEAAHSGDHGHHE